MDNDTLGLYGPEDSKYLRLVARRAAENSIKTAWVAGPTPGCVAYVADTEAGWPLWDLSPEEDVDNIQHPGLSCCAAGFLPDIKVMLPSIGGAHGRLCVIGRGHAVQGLAEAVAADGYAVDQCSSTALDMDYRVGRADIVVSSAREVSEEVLEEIRKKTVVFDVGGGMERLEARLLGYVPKWVIGGWNIAELLRRVRERIRKEREADGGKEGRWADGV